MLLCERNDRAARLLVAEQSTDERCPPARCDIFLDAQRMSPPPCAAPRDSPTPKKLAKNKKTNCRAQLLSKVQTCVFQKGTFFGFSLLHLAIRPPQPTGRHYICSTLASLQSPRSRSVLDRAARPYMPAPSVILLIHINDVVACRPTDEPLRSSRLMSRNLVSCLSPSFLHLSLL